MASVRPDVCIRDPKAQNFWNEVQPLAVASGRGLREDRFRRMRSLQKFAAVHASVYNLFNSEHSLYIRPNFKTNRGAAPTEWRGLCAGQKQVWLSLRRPVRTSLPARSGVLSFQDALYLRRKFRGSDWERPSPKLAEIEQSFWYVAGVDFPGHDAFASTR